MFDYIFPSLPAVLTLTFIAAIFGLILSVAKMKLKVERDPRIDAIVELLPGANCGACGQPGCAGFATRLVQDSLDINLCPVCDAEVKNKIAGIAGISPSDSSVSYVARLHCHGGISETKRKFVYEGPRSCGAADRVMGGFKTCEFGCLGFGDCVSVCPFDAIKMSDSGLPVVDVEKCTGCGKCIEACPRELLSLVPEKFKLWVMCKNSEKAPVMKKGCSVGCIGCKLCEKACKEVQAKIHKVDITEAVPAIMVENFLARIDYDKCINCLKCVAVCPVPVIHPIERSKKIRDSKNSSETKKIVSGKKEKTGADIKQEMNVTV